MKCLHRELSKCGADVAVIDPAYLCMDGADAANVIAQGEHLRRVQDICGEHGACL